MSLPDLLGGGADCGPVNPLQQLGKRIGQDRGAQFDKLQHGPDAAPGRPAAFRSQASAAGPADPAFFASGSVAPFHVDQLRDSLPQLVPHKQWAPSQAVMETSFHRQQLAPVPVSSTSATPAWAQDFLHASRTSAKRTTVQSASNMHPVPAAAAAATVPRGMPPLATQFHHPLHAVPVMGQQPRDSLVSRASSDDLAYVSRTYFGSIDMHLPFCQNQHGTPLSLQLMRKHSSRTSLLRSHLRHSSIPWMPIN